MTGVGRHGFAGDVPDLVAVPVALRRDGAVPLDERAGLYDEASGALLVLNETARAVWERCDGAADVGAIVAGLAVAHGVPPEEICLDVWRTIGRLAELGLVAPR